jgi:hypothetical protein
MREEDLSFNSNYIKTLISLVEVCIMLSGGRHMVGEMKNDEGIYIIILMHQHYQQQKQRLPVSESGWTYLPASCYNIKKNVVDLVQSKDHCIIQM